MSLGVSTAGILLFARRTLHPIYSVCVATVLFSGWIVTLLWVFLWDVYDLEPDTTWWIDGPNSLVIVKDICFVVVTIT